MSNAMKKNLYHLLTGICVLATMSACDSDLWKLEDENKGAFVATDYEPISTMLENNGEFDEWVKVLNYSGTYSVLNSLYTGENKEHAYTHFAPTDSAMLAFYAEKKVGGIEELGVSYAKALVRTMTCDKDSMKLTEKFTSTTNSFGWMCENDEAVLCYVDNQNGGFRFSNFTGKELVHIERNYIKCTNGFVYKVTGVLTPLVETVYDHIVATGNSSIMLEALKATGYDKELATEADTTYTLGKRNVTKRDYTFLNVTDDVFRASGINSLADLKSAIANRASDKSANPDSLLKQYIQYHTFDASLAVSNLLEMGGDTVTIRETLAKNQILMVSSMFRYAHTVTNLVGEERVDSVYSLYFNTDDIPNQELDSVTNDVLGRNGMMHNLTGWMPVYEPKQATVVWDLAAYSDVRKAVGEYYQPATYPATESKFNLSNLPCYTVEMGPDGTSNGSYSGLCYVTCKSNLKNCVYNDRVVFNLGYQGSVAMSSPTLVKGKYRVSISMAFLTELGFIRTMNGCKGGMMRVSIDGENQILTSPYTSITKALAGVYETTLYDEVEFTETSSHVFKFVIMDPAASTNVKFSLQFDAITFTPIE